MAAIFISYRREDSAGYAGRLFDALATHFGSAGNPGALSLVDRHWLLVQHPDADSVFDIFDLKNPKNAVTSITLPASVMTAGKTSSWQLVEWSTDNQHVLLKHLYDDKSEFIVVDRTDAAQAVNLNTTLNTAPTKVTLVDKKYDQYYVYDATTQVLNTASLNDPTLTPYLQHVLEYQSYGSDIMLYASSSSSGAAKVAIDLLQGGKTYSLREVAAGTDRRAVDRGDHRHLDIEQIGEQPSTVVNDVVPVARRAQLETAGVVLLISHEVLNMLKL